MKSSCSGRLVPVVAFLAIACVLVRTAPAFAADTEPASAVPAASAAADATGLARRGQPSYGEIVAARIEPHIKIDHLPADNNAAEVFVEVTSDGTVLSARLMRSSRNPDWDAAAIRPVYEAAKLPLDENGTIPRTFSLSFRPHDSLNPPERSITLDGRAFVASQAEFEAYQNAVKALRAGRFDMATSMLRDFVGQFPSSGYLLRARYWLGNAQFAQRQFEAAQDSLGSLLTSLPADHPLRPEVLLSIANNQLELGSRNDAKETLLRLIGLYPQSATARLAQERLRTLQ